VIFDAAFTTHRLGPQHRVGHVGHGHHSLVPARTHVSSPSAPTGPEFVHCPQQR
jgi:hypothetical protein